MLVCAWWGELGLKGYCAGVSHGVAPTARSASRGTNWTGVVG